MAINYANIKTGDLRNRITIQQKSATTDAIGGESVSWNTFSTVWGMVIPYKGNEALFAEVPRSVMYHKVVIRYIDGLDASMRLQFTVGAQTKTLQIKTINVPNNQYRNFIEMLCEEGSAT